MDSPIKLFKTTNGQEQYFAAYDAALKLWPVNFETRLVTTDYGQTHVISCGSPDAFPLVLLHAGQASSTMWFPNIGSLSEEFHVLAFDTLGEPGKSVPVRHNNTRRDLSAWLEGVLDELGILKTHMMGLSRGGWMTLNFAIHMPDRIKRIVLLSPAASFVTLNSFFTMIAQTVMRIPSRFVSRVALNSWVAKDFVVNDVYGEQFMTGLQNWNWTVNTSGYSGIMPCIFTDEELGQIRKPVLMLIGDQDRLNPSTALERAKKTISGLEGEIITKAGHFLNMEQPETVNARCIDFLTRG